MWWERLKLPQNVDVLEYLVYVQVDTNSGLISEGESNLWRFTPESRHGLVTGLSSHAEYSFSVGAKVRDADGTVFEARNSSKVHVFVPGRTVFVVTVVLLFVSTKLQST